MDEQVERVNTQAWLAQVGTILATGSRTTMDGRAAGAPQLIPSSSRDLTGQLSNLPEFLGALLAVGGP